jgi:DNA-binding XRE family transcriptional regulator
MATTTLHSALRKRLKISDEDFASIVGVHRTRIWAIRTGRTIPRSGTSLSILRALRRLGVEMTLEDLLRKPRAS